VSPLHSHHILIRAAAAFDDSSQDIGPLLKRHALFDGIGVLIVDARGDRFLDLAFVVQDMRDNRFWNSHAR
jgi:hypothetical protein